MERRSTMELEQPEDRNPLYLRIARQRGCPVKRSGASRVAKVDVEEGCETAIGNLGIQFRSERRQAEMQAQKQSAAFGLGRLQ